MAGFDVHDDGGTHVVIELFGGDNNLSPFVMEDIREIQAGNTGPFTVLALADFADGGAAVIELSPRTGARVIEEVGEIDTGDPDTLELFLAKGLSSYPNAEHFAIGFWDHGSGVFSEQDPGARVARAIGTPARWARGRAQHARKLFLAAEKRNNPKFRAMLHDDTNGGLLTNVEAGNVLKHALDAAGRSKVDMVFSDTCLNGMAEVLAELAPYADVIVGSEELEPGDGWDYALWFEKCSRTVPAGAEDWARAAVEAYGESYAPRASEHPVTLAAFRTANDIAVKFGQLVGALEGSGDAGFVWLEEARRRAQSFADRDTYDLQNLATKLAEVGPASEAVRVASRAVATAVAGARVHEVHHGVQVRDAQGLALWVPSSRSQFESVAETYARLEFAKTTCWLEYLAGFYAA